MDKMRTPKSILGFALFGTLALNSNAQFSSVYTVAGTGISGHLDGVAASAKFNLPYGVCYDDAEGAVYIADAGNNVIRKLVGDVVTTIAGTGAVGDVDGPALTARFNSPTGVYFKNGYLYICDDFNNKIKRMDSSGQVVTIAGSGMPGSSDGTAMSASFREPKSIVVDDFGTVYVADYQNNRVRKIMNGTVTTVAGTGGSGDSFGIATNSDIYMPRDLCIGTDGSVYIAALGNNRIKKLTPDGILEPVAGTGIAGWQDGPNTTAKFNAPVTIDWLDQNTLLVLDANNPRIRKISLDGSVTTLAAMAFPDLWMACQWMPNFLCPKISALMEIAICTWATGTTTGSGSSGTKENASWA